MTGKKEGKQREEGFTKLPHEYGSLLGLDLIAAVVLSEIVRWSEHYRENPKRKGWFYRSGSGWTKISPSLTWEVLEGKKRGYTQKTETPKRDTPGAFARIKANYQNTVADHERYGPVISKQVGRPVEFTEQKKPGKETFYKLNRPAYEAWMLAAKGGENA